MQHILAWGLEVVKAVQTIASPILTALMKGITFLGTEQAFLIILPIVYWTIDGATGFKLSMLIFVSSYTNGLAKNILAQPRPFQLDPSVKLATETTYGLPSGHAQGTITLAAYAGSKLKRFVAWILLVLFVLLIGFSRIYLGVHFPTDVFGGWLLGLLITGIWLFGEKKFGPTIARWDIRLKIILIALTSFIMNAFFMEGISLSALFFGTGTGYVTLTEKFTYDAKNGAPWQKIVRVLLGVGTVIGLYIGLKTVFPKEGSSVYTLFKFLRYFLVGFWVSFISPLFFKSLKLIELQKKTPHQVHQ